MKLAKLSLVCIICLYCNITSSNANQSTNNLFINKTEAVFEEDSGIDVLDQNNNSVKTSFIKENLKAYNDKDYETINEYFIRNGYHYNEKKIIPILESNYFSTRISSSYYLSSRDTHNFKQSGFSVSYTVELSSTIRVNESTGVITSYSSPSLSLLESTMGNGQLTRVSTPVSMSSSKRSITITGIYSYVVYDNFSGMPISLSDGPHKLYVSY